MKYEVHHNKAQNLIFRKEIPAGAEGYIDCDIVDHGYITGCKIRFAAGENATLQIRPVVILPGNILLDLFKYAQGGDQYISGDDEEVNTSLKLEIENHSIARIYYKNTGEGASALNADIEVTYLRIIEPVNIIGPQGR